MYNCMETKKAACIRRQTISYYIYGDLKTNTDIAAVI